MGWDSEVEIKENSHSRRLNDVRNPLDVLRQLSLSFTPVTLKDLPPFQGGLVGYFNYDLVRKWERLPGIKSEDSQMPEWVFTFSRRMIIFDHFTHRIKVVVFAHLRNFKLCRSESCPH